MTLYERLGGYDAIVATANDFLPRVIADEALGRFWAHPKKRFGKAGLRVAQVHPSDLAVPAIAADEMEVGTLRSTKPTRRHRELYRLCRSSRCLLSTARPRSVPRDCGSISKKG